MVLVHCLSPPTSLAISQPEPFSASRKTPLALWKPASSSLNQPAPEPSQAEKAPAHLYIHTMMGPWLGVHCFHTAETLSPGTTGASSAADRPPLQRRLASAQFVMGL